MGARFITPMPHGEYSLFLSDSLPRFVCQWPDTILHQFLIFLLGMHPEKKG